MLDLDYFKAANDAYGREADNFVLGYISSLIKKSVRRLDIPCRYEGEEFTIILPNTTLRQEIRFANRLRLIIENPPAKTSDALLRVEASFGVEVYVKGDELTEKAYVEKVAKRLSLYL
jgi:diguanylate cyclase (GGDEF)-like protein